MKTKISRSAALSFAERFVDELKPVCERVEIAGSIRRGNEVVGDIEVVCVPKKHYDLFGKPFGESMLDEKLNKLVSDRRLRLLRNGERYKQFSVKTASGKDVFVEVYITTPERWGVIFTIRTGSAEFSRKLVTAQRSGGFLPDGMYVYDGRLYRGDTALDTPEEMDVFRAIGIQYINPAER